MTTHTMRQRRRNVHWGHDAENVLAGATETNEEVLVLEALENVAGDRRFELNTPHEALAAYLDASVEGIHDVVQVLGNHLSHRNRKPSTKTKQTQNTKRTRI